MMREKSALFVIPPLSREHGIPYCRRSGLFEVAADIELTFTNTMHQLDAGDDEAALLNRLNPSMTLTRDLMCRWSCSIRLFRYFEDRSLVVVGSRPSSFISRTAR